MSMMKGLAILGLCIVGQAMAPAAAEAQLPFSDINTGVLRPSVSPYLNLTNSNNRNISNYFTLVRPQIQAREALMRQQAQISQVQRQAQRGQAGGVPVRGSQEIRGTGHETAYMNYLHYYPARR
jgi:hypothetical protein